MLQYESTEEDAGVRRRRPLWVYVIVGVYGLLMAAALALATWLPFAEDSPEARLLAGTIVVLLLCAASLIMVPVRAAKRRPMTPRTLWIPVLASALLAGLLVVGGGLAFFEYARVDPVWPAFAAGGAVWAGWALVFGLLASRRGPQRVANVLHRWLLAGSVLELLVAVPTHIVVRRREECCAGIATGLGICIGIGVMLAAFGPSVGLLYYRRWKQITPPSVAATPASRGASGTRHARGDAGVAATGEPSN